MGMPGFVFNPAVDTPEHASMLRDARRSSNDLQFTLTSVPTGAYNVYVWTFEPNGPLSLILSLEQNVASNFTTGAAGSWLRPDRSRLTSTTAMPRYDCRPLSRTAALC